tara:strand:- start:38315 stop:38428 length:114 start_codon:yes stop_codon:yes gene_type:complete
MFRKAWLRWLVAILPAGALAIWLGYHGVGGIVGRVLL